MPFYDFILDPIVGPVRSFQNISDAKAESLVHLGAKLSGMRNPEEIIRVSPQQLELLYVRDPVAFNSVNVICKTFLSTGYTILNDHEGKLQDFLNVNQFSDLMFKIVQHLCIYGNAWVALMYRKTEISGSTQKLLAGIDILDPKTMDFLRDIQGNIIFDKLGSPINIIQYLPVNMPTGLGSTYLPNMPRNPVQVTDPFGRYNQAMIIEKDDAAHITLYTIGDNPVGIGILEPLYNVINSKKMIERGLAQSIHRHGFPIMWVKVGDMNNPPNPDELQDAFTKLTQLNERSEIITPYWYDIGMLQPKDVAQLQSHLQYFQDEIVSGVGVPKPFVIGEGEGGSKHILEMQKVLFERNIRMVQYAVAHIIDTEILLRFARENNFPNWKKGPPKLVWEEISTESTESKIASIVNLVDVGVIHPDKELEKYVRRELRLPETSAQQPYLQPKEPETKQTVN